MSNSKDNERIITEAEAFQNHLKPLPTNSITPRSGRSTEYKITNTTFTKSNLQPNRYKAELQGIRLASLSGINVPNIIENNLKELGSITYEFINSPRLDQTIWNDFNENTLVDIGSTLGRINKIKTEEDLKTDVFLRRNKHFLDDMRYVATIPNDYFTLAENTFKKACAVIYKNEQIGFVHGDYGFQNIFNTNPLTVFDWERSHMDYPIFDIGTCLSYMIFATTEGNWSMENYFNGIKKITEGYKLENPNIKLSGEVLSTLRFFSYRVPPQFYLYVIEKLAINDGIHEVRDVLEGKTTFDESKIILRQCGVEMDKFWGERILKTLSKGGYQSDPFFWKWTRKEL